MHRCDTRSFDDIRDDRRGVLMRYLYLYLVNSEHQAKECGCEEDMDVYSEQGDGYQEVQKVNNELARRVLGIPAQKASNKGIRGLSPKGLGARLGMKECVGWICTDTGIEDESSFKEGRLERRKGKRPATGSFDDGLERETPHSIKVILKSLSFSILVSGLSKNPTRVCGSGLDRRWRRRGYGGRPVMVIKGEEGDDGLVVHGRRGGSR
ncbi:hypothetical protein L1987_71480 [Smallanthus sonchifolius]|uniref:Uncharacterized protein n=1 Tax=Smallanthus sonchifolius TaxID=185202 RepID=A0ACB9ASJ7_9ASTR|nr:hypothetical protein L1987_71480 [Smallanthus sonchifolius]